MAVTSLDQVPFHIRFGLGGRLRAQTGQRPTFVRDGIAYIAQPGGFFKPQPHTTPRFVQTPGGAHALRMERSSTNLLKHSNDVTQTNVWGSSAFTKTAIAGIFPGLSGRKVTNDGAATSQSINQNFGALGSSKLALSWIVRNINAGAISWGIRDNTAADWVVLGEWGWNPNVAPTIGGSGVGTDAAVGLIDLGAGLYRLWVAGIPVNSGNTGAAYIYPTGTTQNTDSAEVYHAQIEVQPGPTSPIVTGAATAGRVVETAYWSGAPPWQEAVIYLKWLERGSIRQTNQPGYFVWGTGTATNPRIMLYVSSAGNIQGFHFSSAGVSSTVSVGSVGAVTEAVLAVYSDGSVQVAARSAGGVTTVGAQSAAAAFSSTQPTRIALNAQKSWDLSLPGIMDVIEAKMVKKAALDNATVGEAMMDEMQRVQLDAFGRLVA